MAISKFKTIITVAKKELIDHMRDKRTTLLVLLLSVAMGPLVLMGIGYFISSIEQKFEKKEVFVQGEANSPELVNFMLRQDMTIKTPKADFRELVKAGKHDAVLVIPENFSQKLVEGAAKLELVYDDTRQDSGNAAISVLRGVVRGFSQEIAAQRLTARGVSPAILRPIEVENTNLGTAAQRAAALLFIIPWITLIGCVTGCTSMAVDLGAGERERGSLEPLLMTPIAREGLVLGKALAVSLYAFGIAILTMAGFALTLKFGNVPGIGGVISLSFVQYVVFFAMLATFAPAMALLQILLSTYGRTFKEGQTYAAYAIQVIAILPAVALLGQFKDATWQLFVPVLAQLMVITRILRGETVEVMHYLIPAAMNITIFVACVIMIGQLLKQEKIIFGRA
jgi:sodium transport system permease protein